MVLLNKTYATDIETIVNLKKPTKPNLTLCLNSVTMGRCPLVPPASAREAKKVPS